MDVKLIITDLDRTLLRSDKTISDFTADVLRRCRERGIIVAFATMRPFHGINRLRKIVNPDIVIADGGAEIWRGETLIFRNPISKETTAELLAALLACREIKMISVTAVDGTFTNYSGKPWDEGWEFISTDFADGREYDATKFSAEFLHIDAAKELVQGFPELRFVANTGENWCQILAKNSCKEAAAAKLCEELGIGAHEALAFGDDFSDTALIKWSGAGVAVGNAIDEVRQAADFICADNDSDGVARWLEENIFGV